MQARFPSQEGSKWRSLLDNARRGDARSLRQILDLLNPYLLRIARRELAPKVRVKHSPSDVVQQSLIEVSRALPTFAGHEPTEFLAWAKRILENNALDVHRRFVRSRKRTVSRERSIQDRDARDRLAQMAVAKKDSPSQAATLRESRDRIRRALESLSDEHRAVIGLRDFEQLTYAEIAARMSPSERAVRMLHLRALECLSRAYDHPR